MVVVVVVDFMAVQDKIQTQVHMIIKEVGVQILHTLIILQTIHCMKVMVVQVLQ
jgi:hypothetical protein